MKDKTSIRNTILSIVLETVVHEAINFLKEMNVSKTSINVGEYDYDLWKRINRELYKLSPETYLKMRVPTQNKQFYELETNARLVIRLRNNNWISVRTYKESTHSGIFSEKRMVIKFHGSNKHRNKMSFVRKLLFPERNTIEIKHRGINNISISNTLQSNGFDSVVLPEDQKTRILSGLLSWAKSKQWYKDRGLVYKIGVLLYGMPGTGKSSIAKAISKLFHNAPIISIDPENLAESISYITQTRRKINGTIIVLIEDFDLYCPSRDKDCNNGEEYNDMKKQNMLFQMLDGVYSTENTIYIATTNHIDKLDPAIIRPGRFDIREELEYFDSDLANKFVQSFGYGDCIEMLESLSNKYPIQPALLQSEIMRFHAEEHNERTTQ